MSSLGTFSSAGLGFGLAFTLLDNFTATARQIEREMVQLDAVSDKLAMSVERSMARIRTGVGMVLISLVALSGWMKAIRTDATFVGFERGIETFVGSARKAQEVIAKIKQDALDNPKLKFEEMMRANMMLVTAGVSADKSERLINNLSTILVAVGRGNEELGRMGINLQQLASGAFTAMDVRQFSYAGIDLLKIIKDTLGKTVTASQITVDMVDKAFSIAAGKGSKYFEAMTKALQDVDGKMAQVEERITFTWRDIGEAIRPTTLKLLGMLNALFIALSEFVKTPFGGWLTNILFSLTLVTLAFGALLLIVSLNRIIFKSMVMSLSATDKALVLNSLAVNGAASAWGTLIIRMLPVLIPLAAITAGIVVASKALKAFDESFTNNHSIKPGIVLQATTLEKIGGMLKWINTLFTTYNTETKQFKVPAHLFETLQAMGLEKSALAMATWVSRIIEFWHGFYTTFIVDLKSIAGTFMELVNQLGYAAGWFDKTTSSMDKWRALGIIVGKVIEFIIIRWAILMAFPIMQFLSDVALGIFGLIVQLISWAARTWAMVGAQLVLNAEMLAFGILVAGTIILLGLFVYALFKLVEYHGHAFDKLGSDIDDYEAKFNASTDHVINYGAAGAIGFRNAFDKELKGWSPMDRLSDEIDTIGQKLMYLPRLIAFVANPANWAELSNPITNMAGFAEFNGWAFSQAGLSDKEWQTKQDRIKAREDYYKPTYYAPFNPAIRALTGYGVQDSQPADTGAGAITPIIHNHIYIDGKEVSEHVLELLQYKAKLDYNN